MAIKRMYTIYDLVSKEAGSIVILNNDFVAQRMFYDATTKTINQEDFILQYLGKFDDETMTISDTENSYNVLTHLGENGDE